MPTKAESDIALKQDQYRRIVRDYVTGVDNETVFRARLFCIGYRGNEISTEVNLANMTKQERAKLPGSANAIIVFEHGCEPRVLRFDNAEAANMAIQMLQRQPNVRLACRVTG